jgi:hypothetical protein
LVCRSRISTGRDNGCVCVDLNVSP